MTINVATLCDHNYLAKGLAMRQSLIDLNVDYKIFWLCLDFQTKEKLQKLNDKCIVLFSLQALEEQDEQLRKAQHNPPSKYGSQRDNYIWSLTPYFINHILTHDFIARNEHIMYIDSDIYFYRSPEVILKAIGERSIGIHTHRFSESARKRRKNIDEVGWYNVGVTVFRKDEEGLRISKLWKQWCLDTTNKYYEEFGSCGDQGYLCAFALETDQSNICVFDEEGDISHLAPWCCELDPIKPVVFFHFSHFTFDINKGSWSDSTRGEWKPTRHSHIKPYYEQYFETIKKVSIFTK